MYETWIRQHAEEKNKSLDDVFMCEPTTKNGRPAAKVFSCGTCKHPRTQTPSYDLFDGVQPDGDVVDIGIGTLPHKDLGRLDTRLRQRLGLIKMDNATFCAYSGPAYGSYLGGAALTPVDYSGFMSLPDIGKHKDLDLSSWDRHKLAAGLAHLRTTNPQVHKMATIMERAEADPDAFPAGGGGDSASPAIIEEDMTDFDFHTDATSTAPAAVIAAPTTTHPHFRSTILTVDKLHQSAAEISLGDTTLGTVMYRDPLSAERVVVIGARAWLGEALQAFGIQRADG